jgi:hypothetical protein
MRHPWRPFAAASGGGVVSEDATDGFAPGDGGAPRSLGDADCASALGTRPRGPGGQWSSLDGLAWRLYSRCARKASRLLRQSSRALTRVAQRLSRLSGELLFVPSSDDIYIVSYPRSGTTWLQMILYQLTTDGNMDFHHITEIVPFFERALSLGQNLNARRPPRIFKTHLTYGQIPKGPFRYIYVARNGKDVLTSYFHFHRSHLGFKGTLDDFLSAFVRGKVGYGSWFQHVADWKSHASDGDVLFLRYEDLQRDLREWLPRIAAFCGADIPPGRADEILERCSFAYMKAHESKFDFMHQVLLERRFAEGEFIREGKTDSWTGLLTDSQSQLFEEAAERWRRAAASGRPPRFPKAPRRRPASDGDPAVDRLVEE